MKNLSSLLMLFGISLLVLDMLVLRMILKRKPGHWVLAAGALCVAAAVVLLFVYPPRGAF